MDGGGDPTTPSLVVDDVTLKQTEPLESPGIALRRVLPPPAVLVQTDQTPQLAFPAARVPVISPEFCRDEGGSCLSQAWEERLGSCERAVNQAFVSVVCLHVSASPAAHGSRGWGPPPQQSQMRREGGPVIRDPRPGCRSHTGFSRRCCGYLSVAGARVQSPPLFSFLVDPWCLVVVVNQLSRHQDIRSVEEANALFTLVHLPPIDPIAVRNPSITYQYRKHAWHS